MVIKTKNLYKEDEDMEYKNMSNAELDNLVYKEKKYEYRP